MRIYKFIVPADNWVSDPADPSLQVAGLMAAALANTADEAKAIIRRELAPLATWWLDVAPIIVVLETETPCFVAAAEIGGKR